VNLMVFERVMGVVSFGYMRKGSSMLVPTRHLVVVVLHGGIGQYIKTIHAFQEKCMAWGPCA
jgi:hypothetical protein